MIKNNLHIAPFISLKYSFCKYAYNLISRNLGVFIMKQKNVELIMAIVLILAAVLLSKNVVQITTNSKAMTKGYTIIVDAGHGGNDPGKIGINGEKEKDLNLSIAKELQQQLTDKGIKVVMTREEDTGLYDENSKNKKVEDMRRRCELIDKSKADLTISIHQNSYHQGSIKGAQVFYYEHSNEGKKVAETLQESLVKHLDTSNKRKAKANDSYYLLRKTQTPTVIVECGFLSNAEEAEKLKTESYQKEIAKAIVEGIMDYFK